jgi:DNA-binding transcriptional regulator YdaS (Cro superfamily)
MVNKARDIVKSVVEAAGGSSNLARHLGIKPQAISQWRRVPVNRVLEVEKLIEGKYTRYEIRPDIYGPAPGEAK